MHNVLICLDMVRMYKNHQKQACCLMKLDHRKAYDIVEWDFIEEMLKALGLPNKITYLIMTCVKPPDLPS